ncbi:MAG: carboxypeptidase regulatory-like domain-containing protein [Gemmatimonas sp.]
MHRPAVVARESLAVAACVCALVTANAVVAQVTPMSVTVRGFAYDSLHSRPLRDAMVSVDGTSRTTSTDTNGEFRLDSVTPGNYAITLLHPVLDSIGLNAVTTRVRVNNSADVIQLDIPSFATLWSRACGDAPVPADSGFVFGTVRRVASEQPVAGARVTANYFDVRRDSTVGIRQRRGAGEVHTGVDGSYAVCGLPTDLAIKMVADFDSLSTDVLDLPLSAERLHRRDFLIGTKSRGKAIVTTLRGIVRYRDSENPAVGARVLTTGLGEVRADNRGRFTLPNVPVGTRQIEVLAVGIQPTSVTVDVDSASSQPVAVWMDRVTTLATRDVKAARAIRVIQLNEMELRRERKLGTFVDSTTVRRFPNVAMAYRANTSGGVRGGVPCRVVIDGIDRMTKLTAGIDPFSLLDPRDVAVMEYHHRGITAPIEYKPLNGKPCDVVIIWTTRGLP